MSRTKGFSFEIIRGEQYQPQGALYGDEDTYRLIKSILVQSMRHAQADKIEQHEGGSVGLLEKLIQEIRSLKPDERQFLPLLRTDMLQWQYVLGALLRSLGDRETQLIVDKQPLDWSTKTLRALVAAIGDPKTFDARMSTSVNFELPDTAIAD